MSKSDAKEDNISVNSAKALLILMNATLVLVGIGIVYLSQRLANSDWNKILKTDHQHTIEKISLGLLLFGIVIILIGVIGCVGAWLQQRVMLILYHGFLLLALIFFVAAAVVAAWSMFKAKKWNEEPFPASKTEMDVGRGFDMLYCYAQIPYYCKDAKIQETLDVLNITSTRVPAADLSVDTICATTTVAYIKDFCILCHEIGQFKEMHAVLGYVNRQCPRSSSAVQWCGQNIHLNNVSVPDPKDSVSPFVSCRDHLYSFFRKWAKILLLLSSLVCVLIVICCLCAWMLRRQITRCKLTEEEVRFPTRNAVESSDASYSKITSEKQQRDIF